MFFKEINNKNYTFVYIIYMYIFYIFIIIINQRQQILFQIKNIIFFNNNN